MRQAFFIFLLSCSIHCAYAQQQITFKGNEITMSSFDTVTIIDPVSGAELKQINPPRPVRINQARIYPSDTLKNLPGFKSKETGSDKLSGYLFNKLKPLLDSLDEGNYILSVTNVVIDSKGRLAYYESGGIRRLITKTIFTTAMPGKVVTNPDFSFGVKDTAGHITGMPDEGNTNTTGSAASAYSRVETAEVDTGIDLQLKNSINLLLQKVLEDVPKMRPAQLNGVNVNCTGPVFSSWNYILVKDHKALFTPYPDCL